MDLYKSMKHTGNDNYMGKYKDSFIYLLILNSLAPPWAMHSDWPKDAFTIKISLKDN